MMDKLKKADAFVLCNSKEWDKSSNLNYGGYCLAAVGLIMIAVGQTIQTKMTKVTFNEFREECNRE